MVASNETAEAVEAFDLLHSVALLDARPFSQGYFLSFSKSHHLHDERGPTTSKSGGPSFKSIMGSSRDHSIGSAIKMVQLSPSPNVF